VFNSGIICKIVSPASGCVPRPLNPVRDPCGITCNKVRDLARACGLFDA
jgi:hypothetical protein